MIWVLKNPYRVNDMGYASVSMAAADDYNLIVKARKPYDRLPKFLYGFSLALFRS